MLRQLAERLSFSVSTCVFLAFWSLPCFAAEVIEITADNWKSICPTGKEVDWNFGDFVLRNDKIVAVIAKPVQTRNANMTVRKVAGAIIDLTFRYRPSDQLSCFYPGAAEMPIRYLTRNVAGDSATVTVSTDWRSEQPEMEIDYVLHDGDRHITVTSRYSNPHDEPVQFALRDSVRADRGFTHDLNPSLYLCHDFWWRQAYGIVPVDHELTSVGDTVQRGRPVLGYKGENGSKVTLQPGETYTLTRMLIPGEHDLDVHATTQSLHGESLTPLALVVTDPNGFIPESQVVVTQGGNEIGKALTPDAGPLMLRLPTGDYSIKVTAPGRGTQETEVQLGNDRVVSKLTFPEPGYVKANITDGEGMAIPVKVQFIGKDVEDPDFGPDTKSYGVRNLRYSANGQFTAELAPGEYQAIISRGTEYNADFQTITVEVGKTTELNAKLDHVVDSKGWISADFHSHSTPSGDNTSDQLGRVLNLLAEHIEFAPCTEHNRITTYSPHLVRLQAEQFMATCTGMELTGSPLPISHQNAFPLKHHPHTQDGGGPTTLQNPVAQIERLAMGDDGSDKLVQENHPNLEQIWADADLNGVEDAGFEKMFGFMDVIEVHPPADILTAPGTKTGQYNNVIQSWLRMINKGYRIPGVVNTDAHYNFHGSGWLRNYIKSSTDAPAEIDTMAMVHESEHGHLVLTNGPYLEVTATSDDGTAIAGDDLLAKDGKVSLKIRVQCPNWFDINRVQILVNGRPSPDHNYTRRTTPAMFGDGVVKFDQTVEVELSEDAHLIVATIGDGLKLGNVMGPDHSEKAPVAFNNPIFVDVDEDGFEPNGDLLDLPFPYKAD